MTIDELVGTIGGYGGLDFVTGDTILESASMVQSINGDGSLTMSWTSDHGGVIMAGTVLGDYIMMDTYAPSYNGDGTYKWAPKFSDMAQVLSRTLFFKTVEMTDGTQDTLYTFNYVGAAGTIIEDLNKYVSSLGTGWSVKSGALASAGTISVSFDGDTVKSAATKIADACGANVYYVGRTICIGMSNAYAADAYYNTFVVLGGTRNMAKKTAKGGYSAITQRLTIDADGSRIGGGIPPMTKLLIFDDVYPKMELVITSARCRLCYLLDEKGEKIKDGLN